MADSLCYACRQINPDLFSPIFDNVQYMAGPGIPLPPINWIKRSARAGCPFCMCLIANAKTDLLPDEILSSQGMALTRAISDPHQALALLIGIDDVAHIYCFRIPQAWWHLPMVEIVNPNREVDLISSWIDNCLQHHPCCSSIGIEYRIPTRLLDVLALQPSKDTKLVSGDKLNAAIKYAALSHCWGPPSTRPTTTMKGSMSRNLERISFSDLSLTFKDAVKLTRDLGQRYLWIDSLCIIQDDPEDWVSEASKMAMVYGNALFTLSALSSADGTYGCRVAVPQATLPSQRFCDTSFGPYRVRLFEGRIHKWHEEYGDNTYRHGDFGGNPLRRRAWALQERELSTRSIHFAQNQLLWQCKTLKSSSELPWHEVQPVDDWMPQPMENFVDEDLSDDGPVVTRDRWYMLMEDYMSRLLTEDGDKLPALSGLAQNFQPQMPLGRYLAGLWTNHLPQALLWTTGSAYGSQNKSSSAKRSTQYRAPSWSFLSIDGTVSYESQRLVPHSRPRPDENGGSYSTSDLNVLGFEVQPSGTDAYGSIKKASLSLCGKMIQLKMREAQKKEEIVFGLAGEWEALEATDGTIVGAIYHDIRDEVVAGAQLWCLSIREELYGSEIHVPHALYQRPFSDPEDLSGDNTLVMGLALRQDINMSGTFKRVGMVRWVKKSLFSQVSPSEFTLI
ncbi:HET-domain-containing protein [Tothia fuscella]|uniref:HET-domain-containing protein n=1 Tax=Tothia fuscella TaxID=1048955 RepID=A0A9P4NKD5_9PEZI|nr:HET-domain-containing protein [Tothia fuscella]